MTEAETEIIRLLTELRNLQREELAYRRRVLDDSMGNQTKSIRLQQVANGRQKQAIIVQRVAIGATLLLIVVLAIIAYALMVR